MTYGLVMIVKDGVKDLPSCLGSLKPLISHWTIIDTGSTDGTQDLIRETLAGIPGDLKEMSFVNFGHNRSEAFALAHGTADWLFATDADMTWEVDPDFTPDPSVDAYLIEMGKYTPFSYRLPLLLRGDRPWKSIGAVHEYTTIDGGYTSVATDKVRLDMGNIDRSSPEKSTFYAGLLEQEYAKDPTNPRAVSYLAQTYRDLGRSEEARAMFRLRVGMGGFAEEAFYAAYQAALYDPWPVRAVSLMQAWEMRPTRLEPLLCLVRELNVQGLHSAAYALTSDLPPIPSDTLFVEKWVWEWGLKFERSIAAWWVGEKREAYRLMDELLAGELPAHIRAQTIANRSL
jgi:hypothetical protein